MSYLWMKDCFMQKRVVPEITYLCASNEPVNSQWNALAKDLHRAAAIYSEIQKAEYNADILGRMSSNSTLKKRNDSRVGFTRKERS